MTEEHEAYVGVVYSTGDRYDGYFDSADWSGPGRELRPYWWWWCLCDAEGSLHETKAAAEAEAQVHTPSVSRAPMPGILPSGLPRTV